jgi:hypothetical protein
LFADGLCSQPACHFPSQVFELGRAVGGLRFDADGRVSVAGEGCDKSYDYAVVATNLGGVKVICLHGCCLYSLLLLLPADEHAFVFLPRQSILKSTTFAAGGVEKAMRGLRADISQLELAPPYKVQSLSNFYMPSPPKNLKHAHTRPHTQGLPWLLQRAPVGALRKRDGPRDARRQPGEPGRPVPPPGARERRVGQRDGGCVSEALMVLSAFPSFATILRPLGSH